MPRCRRVVRLPGPRRLIAFQARVACRVQRLEVRMNPEVRAAAATPLAPDHAPFGFGLLPGDTDEDVITGGAFTGQRGLFTRDQRGAVVGVDPAGRLVNRVPTASQ